MFFFHSCARLNSVYFGTTTIFLAAHSNLLGPTFLFNSGRKNSPEIGETGHVEELLA